MGVCFLYGNGGNGEKDRLNFRVFGGLTAPESPKENDIWVKISSTSFEWAILASGASAQNRSGRVLIRMGTGNTNEFQALIDVTPANQLWISPVGCVVGDGSTWKNLDAWIWHSSQWHQFSVVFSARINVVYPAGSTCTISNGTKTYTAPSTGGYWECDVDSAGTWTVTATNGSQSASQSVSITASGQSVSVTLTYEYYIVNGSGNVDYTGGWKLLAYSDINAANRNNIKMYTESSWSGVQAYSTSQIDLSKFSKLYINVSAYNDARPEAAFGVSASKPNHVMWNGRDFDTDSTDNNFTNKSNCAATVAIKSTGVKMIDISSLSGSFYIWTGEDGATWNNAGFTIDKVWLS